MTKSVLGIPTLADHAIRRSLNPETSLPAPPHEAVDDEVRPLRPRHYSPAPWAAKPFHPRALEPEVERDLRRED
jgi:hypothetical protein